MFAFWHQISARFSATAQNLNANLFEVWIDFMAQNVSFQEFEMFPSFWSFKWFHSLLRVPRVQKFNVITSCCSTKPLLLHTFTLGNSAQSKNVVLQIYHFLVNMSCMRSRSSRWCKIMISRFYDKWLAEILGRCQYLGE